MSMLAVGQTDASKSGGALDHVLTQMDTAATNFRTTEASFAWDQYQKVINETETQKGKIYLPSPRQRNSDVRRCDGAGCQVSLVYRRQNSVVSAQNRSGDANTPTGKNRSDLESYLVLGFGGSGHDLLKSYDVKYLGEENALDVKSAKLELIPKSDKVKNTIARILLWIDPARGISVQQQFFEPSGDYRLAKYSDIRVNQKLADSVFKLKTTGKTKVVSPQG